MTGMLKIALRTRCRNLFLLYYCSTSIVLMAFTNLYCTVFSLYCFLLPLRIAQPGFFTIASWYICSSSDSLQNEKNRYSGISASEGTRSCVG